MSATTGEPVCASSLSYSAATCDQSLRVLEVQRGDRCLQQIGPVAAQRERTIERRAPGRDLRAVPQRAVLIGEQHDLAVAHARGAARVVQQHQREQTEHLGLVGHQLGERGAEADRFGAERAAPVVALVEDQVEHSEHGGEAVGQQVRGRHAERDPRVADLALGAHQALGHRRLGYQERPRDLLGAEAAERAQRQRDLRLGRERRVAAGEDQLEAFVAKARRLLHLVLLFGGLDVEQPDLRRRACARAGSRSIARLRAVTMSHAPGFSGDAVARPALGREREGLLRGLLGEVEVAEEADEGGEHPPPLLAKGLLDQRSTSARTSIAPPRRAAGIRAASSIAASRSSASSR